MKNLLTAVVLTVLTSTAAMADSYAFKLPHSGWLHLCASIENVKDWIATRTRPAECEPVFVQTGQDSVMTILEDIESDDGRRGSILKVETGGTTSFAAFTEKFVDEVKEKGTPQ